MPKPLHIFKGAMSGRYYATRSYKVHNAEKGLFEVTGQKEDVTDQIEAIIAAAMRPQPVSGDVVDGLVEALERARRLLNEIYRDEKIGDGDTMVAIDAALAAYSTREV